ncbi:MAG TPA: ABC transporter permease [Devosia sp.]|jgi:NitT/TauT family transport system permease protein|nr:ABC transporter permease [Devosia sp.]
MIRMPMPWQSWLALAALVGALVLPLTRDGSAWLWQDPAGIVGALAIAAAAALGLRRQADWLTDIVLAVVAHGVAIELLLRVPDLVGKAGWGFWLTTLAAWLLAWLLVARLSTRMPRSAGARWSVNLAVPLIFGAWLLLLWQVVVVGAGVPAVLLPPPSAIWLKLIADPGQVWADFSQTFLRSVLIGYVAGCGLGFLVALIADRFAFARLGLLPIGSFVSALPLVGIAPILVMWFGFDWPSKAAVVVVMTFFPMLVNTVAGLNASDSIDRDLLRTYAAGYGQSLMKLRLPAALPFIFNALKINSTLALIGAIVAEFFGTPIVGMGFRINIADGRLEVDLVWAVIAVAALAGSAFYGIVALIERSATFWHPSFRQSS